MHKNIILELGRFTGHILGILVECQGHFGQTTCLIYNSGSHILVSPVGEEERSKEMASVGNSGFSSVLIAPLEKDVFLKKVKKSSCNWVMGSNNSLKSNKIYCGLPESGIEKKSTSNTASNSKKVVEDYNTAMKRMMRNPYEYHHDLGQSSFPSLYYFIHLRRIHIWELRRSPISRLFNLIIIFLWWTSDLSD